MPKVLDQVCNVYSARVFAVLCLSVSALPRSESNLVFRLSDRCSLCWMLWGCPALPTADAHPGRSTVWSVLGSCLGEEVQIRGKVGCSLHMGNVMILCVLGTLHRGQRPLQHGYEQVRWVGQRDRCTTPGIIDITPAPHLEMNICCHLFHILSPRPLAVGTSLLCSSLSKLYLFFWSKTQMLPLPLMVAWLDSADFRQGQAPIDFSALSAKGAWLPSIQED